MPAPGTATSVLTKPRAESLLGVISTKVQRGPNQLAEVAGKLCFHHPSLSASPQGLPKRRAASPVLAVTYPPLQRGPGSRYLRPLSPHLQPLLNTFVPRRGTKPFRLELPLEEENPISQSLLPPQEPTLHPTIPSLAVLHSQGSKKHQSCQIKPGEMVSPTHLPAGNLTELSVDVQAG